MGIPKRWPVNFKERNNFVYLLLNFNGQVFPPNAKVIGVINLPFVAHELNYNRNLINWSRWWDAEKYTTLPLTTTAGDVVRISNPERVLTNPRSQFVLARFNDDIVNCPTLDPDVQQQLGSEWSLVADGNQLILQGPKRGLVLTVW